MCAAGEGIARAQARRDESSHDLRRSAEPGDRLLDDRHAPTADRTPRQSDRLRTAFSKSLRADRRRLVVVAVLAALVVALICVPGHGTVGISVKIFLWGALGTFGFLWLLLRSFSAFRATDDERRAEDRARAHFERYGRWPDQRA